MLTEVKERKESAETLARVLVSSGDAREMRELAARLGAFGCAALAAPPGAPALRMAREARPDLILVGASEDRASALALGESIKRNGDTHHIPVAVLVQHAESVFRRACLTAGIDDVVRTPLPDTVLTARLRRLLRLAELAKELERRRETMRTLGLVPAEADADWRGSGDTAVLCVRGRTAAAEESAMARALAEECVVADAPYALAASEMLMDGRYGALVLIPDGDMQSALRLCAQVRDHPRLADFPVMLIADADSFEDAAAPYRSGASLVLTRPFDVAELRDQVLTLARREQRRRELERALAATLTEQTGDPETKLYGRNFFTAHLSRLIADAGLSQRPLALALYELRNIDWSPRRHVADAVPVLHAQATRALAALIRAGDLPARVGDATVAVIFPDTAEDEALMVSQRVAGALLNAAAAVKSTAGATDARPSVETAVATAEPADTVEGLLERARARLR